MPKASSHYRELIKIRNETSEKVKEIVKKEVAPLYKELAGRIEAGLENDTYMPHK